MIAIKKGNSIDIYDVEIDIEKLRLVKRNIKKNCCFIVEKNILMSQEKTEHIESEYFKIVSSIPKESNLVNKCHVWHIPDVLIYIDELIRTGSHKEIFSLYNSLNNNAKLTVTKQDIIKQCKTFLFTRCNEDLDKLNKMLTIFKQEKVIRYPQCNIRQFRDEILDCFKFIKIDSINIKSSNIKLQDGNYKLMPQMYFGLGKNKVLKKVLKSSENNLTNV